MALPEPRPVFAGHRAALERSPRLVARRRSARLFLLLCRAMTWVGLVFLLLLLAQVMRAGLHALDLQFFTSFPSRSAERAGIRSALAGTIWMSGFVLLFSVPLGIAAAIYLEEFARPGRLASAIEINIANLAGVPSIVYGILGLMLFVRGAGLSRSVLAGALTMSLLVLPTIVIAAREALRAVPPSLRHAAFALGATRWQAVRDHVLPAALPGVLTGVILAMSRAIGETAPLIMLGALTYVAFVPKTPLDEFTTLPIQIFNWTSRPQPAFHDLAAAGIIVMLVVLFLLNGAAVWLRLRSTRANQ